MLQAMTLADMLLVLAVLGHLAVIVSVIVKTDRRITAIETYMRLILPKLGITLADEPRRNGDRYDFLDHP